jgi:hypothetical protein
MLRKNRDAAAGVFVMARSHATACSQGLRASEQRLVTWDKDPATDASSARLCSSEWHSSYALQPRATPATSPPCDIEARIEASLSLEKMEKHSDAILNVDGISDEIRKAQGFGRPAPKARNYFVH